MKNDNSILDKIRTRKIHLNPVKNRFLPLSESVAKGLESEPTIQDFKIKKEIGTGSFGHVYLASHIKTNVDYAIKVIDKRNKTNIDGRPYFRREIEIMYKIRHPNCVRLFGNFEDENFCYFIMEYIPGGNLYSLMSLNRNTGLNIYLVARILRELVSAIHYLHNMNPPIIHRDIKPENVLLTDDSNIKLTDFGWSNYINFEGEQRLTFCGTPIYLAPEMIQNTGHDKHVDIWCLGVLLFELLTGTPPFIGQNRMLLMKNIINVKIDWPSPPRLPIDPDAKDLISKILRKKPKERLSLENIVKHNFFIKYCPNIKPVLDKKQKYHLKPFIVSQNIPNDDDYYEDNEDNENDNNYENMKFDLLKKSLRHLLRTSKKNKYRDITPSPSNSNLCLEKKSKSNSNLNNLNKHIFTRQNTKTHFKVHNNLKQLDIPKGDDETIKTFSMLRDFKIENEKLVKENENLKLREIGYNKKIEELTFALNNLNQENMLLKMELDKHKKELEKKKKEINILRSRRNLNLNLNNQTTVNINTSINRSNNYKGLNSKNTSRKKNNGNTIIRTFISKTPEGLQRNGRKIILANKSFMKPYLKKNALINKSNKSINKDNSKEDELNDSNSFKNSNKLNKVESATFDVIKVNKDLNYNNIWKIKEEKNISRREIKEITEKEKYKNKIIKLENEKKALKEENLRIKKYNEKSLNKDSVNNIEKKNF